jgi:hypothetical protein
MHQSEQMMSMVKTMISIVEGEFINKHHLRNDTGKVLKTLRVSGSGPSGVADREKVLPDIEQEQSGFSLPLKQMNPA